MEEKRWGPELIAKTGPTIQQLGLQENHTSYTLALVACNQYIHPPSLSGFAPTEKRQSEAEVWGGDGKQTYNV